MTMALLVRGVLITLVLAGWTSVASVAGKWRAELETPDGQKGHHLFNFQVDGEKVTGTVYSSLADAEAKIEEGSIKGDDLSFAVTRNLGGQDMKFRYKGKVAGDEIKFTMTIGDGGGMQITMVAKREK